MMALKRRAAELKKFRKDLADIADKDKQDVHLSWLFHLAPKLESKAKRAAVHVAKYDSSSSSDHAKSDSEANAPPADVFATSSSGYEEQKAAVFKTSSDEEVMRGPLSQPRGVSQPRGKAPYKERNSRYAISILGHSVCFMAAKALIGVGLSRLKRINAGDGDARKVRKPRGPEGAPLKSDSAFMSSLTFLWRTYHHVAEGLPDRFSFAKNDAHTAVIGTAGDGRPQGKVEAAGSNDADDDEVDAVAEAEHEDRIIAAAASNLTASRIPDEAAIVGPGTFKGPMRYLPPCKRIHLWWEYAALQAKEGSTTASYSTFRRAFNSLNKAGVLRIRKIGSHAVCTMCQGFKSELRRATISIAQREQTMELYAQHLVDQWSDRQVYDHMQDLSRTCMHMVRNGNNFGATLLSSSVLTVIVDGMDQAKFRIPR